MARHGRPPLPVGQHGVIKLTAIPSGWMARTRLRLMDGTTVLLQGNGSTQRAARAALAERVDWRRKGAGVDGVTADTSVRVLVERWLDWRTTKADIAARSLGEYTAVAKTVIGPRIGNLRCGEVTPGIVDSLIDQVVVAQPGRARHARTILRQSFAWAVRNGALTENPVHDLAALPSNATKAPRALTEVEVGRLRTVIATLQAGDPRRSPDIAHIVDLMLATGCRIGEVLALRWKDVDLASAPATIHIAATEVQDSTDGHHIQEARKGRARRADEHGLTYRLPTWAATMLLEQRVSASASEFVFPARGGGLRSQVNVRRSFRQALEGTEFEGKITPHVMRKTVGTAVADELGVAVASKQLGHKSEAVTKRHYVADAPTTPEAAAGVLERFAPKRDAGL